MPGSVCLRAHHNEAFFGFPAGKRLCCIRAKAADAVRSVGDGLAVVVLFHHSGRHLRSGLGLVLAEAMYVGTPTIATNWSANTEFMNSDVACMVDYKMIEIKEDIPPFKKGYRWADADINQAAGYMKRLYEDKAFYQEIKDNAYKYVRKRLSMERSAKIVADRISEIYSKKNGEEK